MATEMSEAIKALNSEAQYHIIGGDIDTCTINWLADTPAISRSDIKAKMAAMDAEKAQAEIDKAADKTSGTNKLKALGLTDSEITALID